MFIIVWLFMLLALISTWLTLGFAVTTLKLIWIDNHKDDPFSSKGIKAAMFGPFAVFIKWDE